MDEEQQPIAEEQPVNQQVIPFEGDDLAAAQAASGDIYVSVPGICTALGLNATAQITRIQRTPVIAKGLRRMRLRTEKRGVQLINCLRIDRVALWLAGVETSRLKPEIAAKIEAYQDELAPVAMRVFMRAMGMTPATAAPAPVDPRLAALAEEADALIDLALFVREHATELATIPARLDDAVRMLEALAGDVDTLKVKTAGLTPAQAAQVREAVEIIVDASKGGPQEMNYQQVYKALARRFKVAKYSQIPDTQYEAVIMFLREMWRNVKVDDTPEQGKLL